MTDADVLRVEMQERLDTDEVILAVFSRHFDYRGALRFTRIEAPPEQPAVQMAMAALGPLFRAYVAMPFSQRVLKPLLVATMDQLLPELYRAIREQLHPLVLRPGRRRLVPDRNPPIENFLIQGEVGQRHMDRLEAAFRQAREADDGRLVSLDRGETVQPPREPNSFFPENFFRTGRPNDRTAVETYTHQRQVRPVPVQDTIEGIERIWTASELLPAHTHDPRTNTTQIFRTAYEANMVDFEEAIFFGTGRRGFGREAVERARETLIHCLNPVQRAEFERTNSFTVVAQDNRMYKVLPEDAYNVEDEYYRYCCVPAEPCPVYDKMLASKLWLEAQFHDFMATANRSPKRRRIPTDRPHPRMYFDFDLAVRNPTEIARLLGP